MSSEAIKYPHGEQSKEITSKEVNSGKAPMRWLDPIPFNLKFPTLTTKPFAQKKLKKDH